MAPEEGLFSRDFQTVRDEMQTLRSDMAGIQKDLAGADTQFSAKIPRHGGVMLRLWAK